GTPRNTLVAQQCETGPNILYHRVNLVFAKRRNKRDKMENTLVAQQCETGPNILYHRVNLVFAKRRNKRDKTE
ncbi:3400_t:CDS:2, partial [Gigaspora margarita]